MKSVEDIGWALLLGQTVGFLLGWRIGKDHEAIRTYRIARDALSTPAFLQLMKYLRPEKKR